MNSVEGEMRGGDRELRIAAGLLLQASHKNNLGAGVYVLVLVHSLNMTH